jgi:hypothetical protein
MADILNDDPDDFAVDPQIQDGGDVNVEMADEFRASLRSLNALARGSVGLPRYSIHSVLEFGAGGNGTINNYQAFQDALASFGPTGGTLIIPPGTYLIDLALEVEDPPDSGIFRVINRPPLTMPQFVHVQGAGAGNTILVFRFAPTDQDELPVPGIRFANGDNHGRISDLQLLQENSASPVGIGLSFTASQFNLATRIQVWDFAIGIDVSDGITAFSAYNQISNFLVSRCRHGIRCYRHGNGNWIERGRVFWALGPAGEPGGNGTGVGIDIGAAQALVIRSVAVESANTCLRFRPTEADPETPIAFATCEVSGCYFEPGPPPPSEGQDPLPGPFRVFDIAYPSAAADPGGQTYLRFGANRYEATDVGRLDVPSETLADLGVVSQSFFGAYTHFAAHAHRQFSENHDLHMYSVAIIPGGWGVHNSATLSEETADFFSGGRTLRITRTAGAGDGVRKRIRVPEDVGWVTVGFRYKNISSTSINYFARSGNTSVNGADAETAANEPAGTGYRERWLQLRKEQASDEVVATIEIDHGPQNGTSILVDAIWCVPGRVRTADFRYEQGVLYLERPQQVLERTDVVANESWALDWTTLTGLATAPRGTVGAILGVHLTARRNNDGGVIPRPIWVSVAATVGGTVYAERDGRASTRQIAIRRSSMSIEPTTIRGGFITELGTSFSTDYTIFVVGWILG